MIKENRSVNKAQYSGIKRLTSIITEEKIREFVGIILLWASENLRDFPWRKNHDPYLILVAEIMLQRTRAEQVVPVFDCFRRSFPTPKDLVEASPNKILKCIASLGLRKRAVGLKRLALKLVSDYEGKVPRTQKELLELFGVGHYVANAVLSVAFEKNVPAIDSNFARVLKRVFSLKTSTIPQKDKNIILFANNLVSHVDGNFKIFNWAIIDFSNMMCLPRKPKCPICPLNSICDNGIRERSGRRRVNKTTNLL
jgi:A/G-specific adenine glycosylase